MSSIAIIGANGYEYVYAITFNRRHISDGENEFKPLKYTLEDEKKMKELKDGFISSRIAIASRLGNHTYITFFAMVRW